MELVDYLTVLLIIVIVLSFFMVRYYASPRTSIVTQLLSTVGFATGFAGTLLLPIDLSLNIQDKNDKNDADAGTKLPWHIIFFTSSALAWVILPIVKEMILSGEFTIYKRFKDGARKRLRFVLIVVVVVLVLIIWLAFYLHSLNVIPVLITVANTYGLLMVSLLLGYGLIALPRAIWRQASANYELRKAQIMAVAADEALFEAVWELQDCEYSIDAAVSRIVDLDENSSPDIYYKYCVNDLLQRKHETAELKAELHTRRIPHQQQHLRRESEARSDYGKIVNGDKPSMDELVSLNRRLKHAQETLYNTEKRWEYIVERNRYFNEIISKWRGKLFWIIILRMLFYRVIASITILMSGSILLSEATLGFPFNLSPFALVQEEIGKNMDGGGYHFLFLMCALAPLLYMYLCVSSSLFKLTFFGPYALRGYRQSHGAALILNAQVLARWQFPLGYNYLLMLKYDTSTCAFSDFIGQMDVVPILGSSFSVYAPLLIIALCVFTWFDVYPKLMNLFNIHHEDAIMLGDKETIDLKVNEGIELLRQRSATDTDSLSCELQIVHNDEVHEIL
mmetsp:Transcript_4355/g.5665  ORF Transcript_4355/g.5665 Transcript_4355/m.5665 type:complete len:564 (+) Transcript_4355:165-1856(+)